MSHLQDIICLVFIFPKHYYFRDLLLILCYAHVLIRSMHLFHISAVNKSCMNIFFRKSQCPRNNEWIDLISQPTSYLTHAEFRHLYTFFFLQYYHVVRLEMFNPACSCPHSNTLSVFFFCNLIFFSNSPLFVYFVRFIFNCHIKKISFSYFLSLLKLLKIDSQALSVAFRNVLLNNIA